MSDGRINHNKLVRGAFLTFDADGNEQTAIPFRFNPEALSRSLQVEQGKTGGGTEGAAGAGSGGSTATQQAADASTGATRETMTVQVRLDLVDRIEHLAPAAISARAQYGILPEISMLESLVHPGEPRANAGSQQPVAARGRRPTVLFVWGKKRILPVRITSMTINETAHTPDLFPSRAEIDVALEVLGLTDAKDNSVVSDALAFTASTRNEMVAQYVANNADQGERPPVERLRRGKVGL